MPTQSGNAHELLMIYQIFSENDISTSGEHLSVFWATLILRMRLSELFCAVLCTEVVHSHKHT